MIPRRDVSPTEFPPPSATPAAPPRQPGRWLALLWLALTTLLAMSSWFSGTAVVQPLRAEWALSPALGAWLTIAAVCSSPVAGNAAK